MDTGPVSAAKRRFAGRRGAGRRPDRGFDVLADVLLSPPVPANDEAGPRPRPPPPLGIPRGPYALAAAGIEPEARRRTALAAAVSLAPRSQPAALFIFQDDRADAHVIGEPACGRLGPQNFLHGHDVAAAVGGLARQCEQIGVVLLDGPGGNLRQAAALAGRVVFLATPEPESLLETYREMKQWSASAARTEAALLVLGCEDDGPAKRLHRRLQRVSRECLGVDVGVQGTPGPGATGRPEPLKVLQEAPAREVWRGLLGATAGRPDAQQAVPAPPPAPRQHPGAPIAAFSLWQRPERDALIEAIQGEVPALLGPRFRAVLRVDVDEPDAPALAAVRDDGALVAIVVGDGAAPDTRLAQRWLAVHRSLLERAYPTAGIAAGAAPAVIVLAPWSAPPATDGIRRFLPVRAGGRKGVVLLP